MVSIDTDSTTANTVLEQAAAPTVNGIQTGDKLHVEGCLAFPFLSSSGTALAVLSCRGLNSEENLQ